MIMYLKLPANWFHAAQCSSKTTNEVWDVRYLLQKGDLQPDPLHRVYQMTSWVAFTRMSTAADRSGDHVWVYLSSLHVRFGGVRHVYVSFTESFPWY